jgi:SRSO17 transposase
VEHGVPAGVVLPDAAYGNNSKFHNGLEALGPQYMLGIQSTATEWREGSAGIMRSRFAAVRIRAALRDYWRALAHSEQWLLIEWPKGKAEPTKYWVANLSATTPFKQLVRIASLRLILVRLLPHCLYCHRLPVDPDGPFL